MRGGGLKEWVVAADGSIRGVLAARRGVGIAGVVARCAVGP